MRLSFELLDTEAQIKKAILEALLSDVNKTAEKAAKRLKRKLPIIIETAITSQPEYSELISGKLREQFGIPNAATKIDSLLSIWKNIEVKYKKARISGDQIKTAIVATAIRSDYKDVLNTAAAYQTTEKGQQLYWLDWLLNQGDKIIVKEYELVTGRGRAGNVVMRKNVRGKWGVPSAFAGTPNNNWITRSLNSVSSIIDRTLEEALK